MKKFRLDTCDVCGTIDRCQACRRSPRTLFGDRENFHYLCKWCRSPLSRYGSICAAGGKVKNTYSVWAWLFIAAMGVSVTIAIVFFAKSAHGQTFMTEITGLIRKIRECF